MKIRSIILTLALTLFAAVVPAMAHKDTVTVKGKRFVVHHVEKGETLYSLSRQYGVTIDELTEANKCLSNGLKSGQRLKVPVKDAQATQEQTPAAKGDDTDATTGATVNSDAVAAPIEEQPKSDKAQSITPPSTDVVVADSAAIVVDSVVARPLFRKLQKGDVAEVALILPIGTTETPEQRYVDFYRGFLIGLDSVRMAGYSVNLNLYNSGSYEDAVSLINSGALENTHLVVGPVYEDQLIPVAAAMKDKGTPVVSPLARLEHITSDIVFQMSPSQKSRHLKIPELQDSTARIVIVSGENVDKRFDGEVRAMLEGKTNIINHKFAFEHPSVTQKYAVERAQLGIIAPGDLKPYLRGNRPTVMFITSGSEFDLGQILAALTKAKKSLTMHREQMAPLVIVGNSRWNRYPNIERELFFDHNIVQISTYHSRRSEPIIRRFDRRFIREFGVLPTSYAYRGYDAAMMFVKELYNSIDTGLEGVEFKPLLTPYKFEVDSVSGVRVNTEWVKIIYNSDFSITND